MLIGPNIVALTETGKDSSKDSSCAGFIPVPSKWSTALGTQGSVSPLPVLAALWERGARDLPTVLQLGKGTCWYMQAAETLGRGLLGQRDGQEMEFWVGGSSECCLPCCFHAAEDMLTLTRCLYLLLQSSAVVTVFPINSDDCWYFTTHFSWATQHLWTSHSPCCS